MSYLGTPPQSGFITTAKQRVTSSTNAYVDLDHAISSIADVIVFVNFVKQDTTNLTLTTSTRITLGATLVSSDIVEIHYLGKAVNTQTPATGTVTNDMLAGSIANAKLANSSITLNGSAVSLGGSATVGGENTPYFHVTKSADQSISSDSFTTVTFDSEIFDSGNAFASNTFTAPSSGYYFIYSQLVWSGTTNSDYSLNRLMKNGSPVNWVAFFQTNSSSGFGGRVISLSASDTVTVQCYQDSGGSLSLRGGSEDECQFGGYKLIT